VPIPQSSSPNLKVLKLQQRTSTREGASSIYHPRRIINGISTVWRWCSCSSEQYPRVVGYVTRGPSYKSL
jgi:hypothetical protein